MGDVEERQHMIGLQFDHPIQRVVCLGAHCDDIEIGAFSLINRLAAANPDAEFLFVIATGDEVRASEAEASMRALVGERGTLEVGAFRDGFIPYDDPSAVKEFFVAATAGQTPDLVLGPHQADRHQDHRTVAQFSSQLFRQSMILEYEIAKFDADLGRPQVFVTLSDDEVNQKLAHLENHFGTQHSKSWYEHGAFEALLRLRGIESGGDSRFAEAFHVSKLLLR